jgi:D-tyrosyl-tRNA(Tyr) deacylase
MRAVIQRVTSGSVSVNQKLIASIQDGFVILLGVEEEDTEEQAEYLAKKIANLRVFSDEEGRMNLSLYDTGGSALVVSQFTLMADTRKGNRPSFIKAAQPDKARLLVDHFAQALSDHGIDTQSGEFGAHMAVSIQNDGPVTIILDY